MKKNIIIIPVYKSSPDETEKMSLRQCVEILGRHELCLLCPRELDVTAYTELVGHQFRTERFDEFFFKGISGYNELLKSKDFYERFEAYEYILIYQLDAWVFEDSLDYWCSKGYDYIGAPWFKGWLSHEEGSDFLCVGNGGFSLRKVNKFLQITDPSQRLRSFWQILKCGKFREILKMCNHNSDFNSLGAYMIQKKDRWEDVFFCYDLKGTRLELNTPDCYEASLFSIETSPEYIFKNINKSRLPFGCHAWKRYHYEDFWSKFIYESELKD